MKKSQEQKIQRISEMQKLFDQLEPKIEQLSNLVNSLQEINREMHELNEFYSNEWLELHETMPIEAFVENNILGEDPIYDLVQQHYDALSQLREEAQNSIAKTYPGN